MAGRHDKDVEYVGDSRVIKRRGGPLTPPDYAEFPGKTEPFYPNFLLKEWMIAVVSLVAFLVLTMAHPSPLEAPANPNDTSYTPLPDWYFFFLYQLLKYEYTSGPYTVVGTILIPGLAFAALLLAPWLDRGPKRRPKDRPVATSLMLLALAAIVFLTWAAVDEHQKHVASQGGGSGAPTVEVSPDAPEGEKIWAKQTTCQGCHGVDLKGSGFAPSLEHVGSKLSKEQIAEIIKNGKGQMPPGQFQGSEEELQKLAEWLAQKK